MRGPRRHVRLAVTAKGRLKASEVTWTRRARGPSVIGYLPPPFPSGGVPNLGGGVVYSLGRVIQIVLRRPPIPPRSGVPEVGASVARRWVVTVEEGRGAHRLWVPASQPRGAMASSQENTAALGVCVSATYDDCA